MSSLEDARARLSSTLDGVEGIIGTVVGTGNQGPAIVVYVRGTASDKVPCDFEGFEVCTLIVSENYDPHDVIGG